MSVRILGYRVLIRPDEPKRTTASGLHLPDNAQELPLTGTVVKVGPGRITDTGLIVDIRGVTVGDRVIFGRYAGSEFEVEGVKHRVMSPDEILAVEEAAK